MKGLMDYSAKKTLTFQARGDGRRYMLMVISGLAVEGIPLMSTSRRVRSGRRCGSKSPNSAPRTGSACVRSAWARMGPVGPFRFQIDDVRLE